MSPSPSIGGRPERWYATVWRWHFYAGLFCIPFVLWLSVTGGIYLFKPQIEEWLYAPYRGVAPAGATPAAPSRLAAAGVAAVPGGVLHRYILPRAAGDAVEMLVGDAGGDSRVWVHPVTAKVMRAEPEESRPMPLLFRLHGELLAGRYGSAPVEIAACWTIVMILSGLFLWWPRGAGLAGVLVPSIGRGRRRFWRDLHAVTGFWVSLAAIFLILSGLPWAKSWGDYLREVRVATGTAAGPQDWSGGAEADARARAMLDRAVRGAVAGHEGHDMPGMAMAASPGAAATAPLDRVVPAAEQLRFAGPVEITPPRRPGGPWRAQSQSEIRALRDAAEIAPDGRLVGVRGYAANHWIDRAIGLGIAVHEGAWAGLANQIANLTVLLGLVTLAVSSVVLWWRRRPDGVLGAPPVQGALRHSGLLVALVVMLGVLMPLFGVTLALVAMAERAVRGTDLARWLGLRRARAAG